MNYNFDEMSLEDISYFKNGYLKVMQSLKAKVEEAIRYYDQIVPEEYRFNNIDLTMKGKLLFLAKKLAVNTALTFFTGVKPMYLDTGVEALTRRGRYNKYLKTDPAVLSRFACIDLQRGLDAAIEMLNVTDEAKLRENLKKFDAGYREMAEANIKSNLPCYAINLAIYLMNNLKILNNSTHDKIHAIYTQKYNLGLNENFYLELDSMYKEYENNKAKRM